jgi:hypothetical protein
MQANPPYSTHDKSPPKMEPKSMVAIAPKQPSSYLMTRKGYLHPMKTYIWINLFVVGIMSALWYVVGLAPDAQGTIPPSFAFGASDLFFHSIAIGICSLLALLAILAFKLDKDESQSPHLIRSGGSNQRYWWRTLGMGENE